MRTAPLITTLGAALLLVASPMVDAMGFGRTVTATNLGQRLNFSADVFLESDESLPRECVGAEVFVGDALLPSAQVRVTLEPTRDGVGRTVRVTTTALIDEPIVTVEVSIGCNSRVSRRFVTFVDPPLVYLARAQVETLPPQQAADTRTAPILEASRSGAPARRPAPVARRTLASPDETIVSAEPKPRRTRAERATSSTGGRSSAGAAGRGTPRLQLEASPLIVAAASPTVLAPAVPPSAPSAASAAASPSASAEPVIQPLIPPPAAVVAAAPVADAERERMQAMEAGLARLTAESKANQQSIATLQSRLRQAENDRYANGLVYALAAGLLFFALLAVALWLLRPRQRQRARWFDATANQQARAQRRSGEPAEPMAEVAEPTAPVKVSRPGPLTVPAPAQSTIGGLEVTTVIGPEVTRPMPGVAPELHPSYEPSVIRRSGPMSMEELIDLEQQAEFFVVLGQDEAAIELLAAHVREGEGVSPLPFLKLLEIHRRRDDRLAYERVREAFKDRFDAFAPDWNADLQRGRSLEDFAQTIARLQALWPTPMQAMQALDSLLFRRSEADEAFDFPAYRDLLFLYSVARELTGNVDTELGPIDLFLPLDDVATAPMTDLQSLDLDVDSLQPDAGEEFVIRRSPGRRGAA